MLINLSILAYELSEYTSHVVKTKRFQTDELYLKGVCLYKKNMPFYKEICYVISASTLGSSFSCPSGITLIVAGDAPAELFYNCDASIMSFEVSNRRDAFYELFNSISSVFIKFHDTDEKLRTAIIKNASLQEIVTFGETLFHNPIIVFDRNYCVLNEIDSSIKGIEWTEDKWSGTKMLPLDTVNSIKTSPEYVHGCSSGDTYFISDGYLNYNTILSSVNQGSVMLTIAIMETNTPLTVCHKSLARYFAGIIYMCICKNNFSSGHSIRFEEFLKELLYNNQIEQAVIDRSLQTMGWKNTDNYICATFQTNRWDKINSMYNNICINLENQFPNSFAFYYDENIVMLVNLDLSHMTKPQLLHSLSGFLTDGVFHVGVSYIFFEFSTFSSYYRQTLGALEMGGKYRPYEWCYDFQDYALHYFMHYGTSRIDGRHLCFPGVVRLYTYDYENHTDLLNTLRVYLECERNAAPAAKKLFIHRNTLYQRIERINGILDADLNDPDVRLYILMSYKFVSLLSLEPVT